MGKTDVMVRQYMSDPERFADAFNFAAYGGERVIDPNALRPLDTELLHSAMESGGPVGERRRDGLREWQVMRDERAAYALLGVEDQTHVDYAMPVRCMLYDALSFMDQVDGLKRKNRRSGDLRSDEWLSGLRKSDTLLPVATLVIHFGANAWDGSLSLSGMLSTADERLMRLVPEYRLNLLSPASLDADDLSKFRSELGLVLGYIRYAHDKDELMAYVRGDERFHDVELDTANLVNELTDSRLEYRSGEERVDMCKAIEDMRAEALDRGLEQGILKTLADLVRDGVLAPADAAARAGMDIDEFLAKASARR